MWSRIDSTRSSPSRWKSRKRKRLPMSDFSGFRRSVWKWLIFQSFEFSSSKRSLSLPSSGMEVTWSCSRNWGLGFWNFWTSFKNNCRLTSWCPSFSTKCNSAIIWGKWARSGRVSCNRSELVERYSRQLAYKFKMTFPERYRRILTFSDY